MASDAIRIVDYDRAWPRLFQAEHDQLVEALSGEAVIAIEHFGSTAVPGLAAKPVIDILVAVPDLAQARAAFPDRLASLGYRFWADNPKTDRLFFVKGLPPEGAGRTHHVHVTQTDGEMWHRLAFRDFLRANPTEAAAYAVLKRQLAAELGSNRDAYTDAKEAFIARIMALATGKGD